MAPMPIPVTFDDGVAVIALELGRGNAIDPAFITALHGALDEVERSDARAAVVTGKGRVFCGGLDLVALHAFDRPTMERFIDDFDALFRRLFSFARPVVAAVNGHAIAGGAVLALSCDLRVMADGPHHFSLNEVQLGIPFPPATFEIVRRATPAAARSAVLLQGRRFSPARRSPPPWKRLASSPPPARRPSAPSRLAWSSLCSVASTAAPPRTRRGSPRPGSARRPAGASAPCATSSWPGRSRQVERGVAG
jgi:enoyl-CoA hydratase